MVFKPVLKEKKGVEVYQHLEMGQLVYTNP